MTDNLTLGFNGTFLSTLPCGPCPTCEYIQYWPWSDISFLIILLAVFVGVLLVGWKLFNIK